jgi:uncharacterized iron-regulated membrane protein
MKIKAATIRQWHRWLAPVMILPILLTVITGIVFQIGELGGFEDKVGWLIRWHKGDFGFVDFQRSFPFLNGIGLLFLTVTGISMWWKTRKISTSNQKD